MHPKLISATKHLVLILICSACLLAAPLFAAAQGIPPAPTQWVTDSSAFLSPATSQDLNSKLEAYQRSSGHQILVWIGKTSGGDSIDDWANRAFKDWKVGRKGIDDGVVLFVMADDRTARIEVGYGLEGQLPDATASRIVSETLIPGIKAGDRDGAVSGAVARIVSAFGGKLEGTNTPSTISLTPWQTILLIVGLIVLVILGFRYPVFGYYLLMIVSTIMRRGGGGSSAGGGGGRSGGGGAGGKW